jgi:hypothetical protein
MIARDIAKLGGWNKHGGLWLPGTQGFRFSPGCCCGVSCGGCTLPNDILLTAPYPYQDKGSCAACDEIGDEYVLTYRESVSLVPRGAIYYCAWDYVEEDYCVYNGNSYTLHVVFGKPNTQAVWPSDYFAWIGLYYDNGSSVSHINVQWVASYLACVDLSGTINASYLGVGGGGDIPCDFASSIPYSYDDVIVEI